MTAPPGPYYGTHTQPTFQPPPPPPPQFVYNPYDQPLMGQPMAAAGGVGQFPPPGPAHFTQPQYTVPPHQYNYGGEGGGGGQYYPAPPTGGYQTTAGPQDQQQRKMGCCESFMQSLMCCCAGMFCFMCLCSMCEDMNSCLCMDHSGLGGMDSFVNDD